MVSFIFCYADVRYDELNKKAKDGDQDAQYSLARLYFTGYGIQKDYNKSFALTKELADKKNPKGIHLLAIHFMLGCGTEQNTAMAIKLFEEASKLGNLNSTIGLANMYLNGYKNLPKDYKKAYILYSEIEKIPLQEIERKGGMKEDVGDVYSNLGVMYLEGLYVDRDVVKAIDLLERSFALGSDIAANNLGSIYYSDKYGVNNYKKSREWFEIAAKQKNKQAIYSLATLYIDGKGVEKDLRKGLEYLYEGAALKSERCIEKIEEIAPKIGKAGGISYAYFNFSKLLNQNADKAVRANKKMIRSYALLDYKMGILKREIELIDPDLIITQGFNELCGYIDLNCFSNLGETSHKDSDKKKRSNDKPLIIEKLHGKRTIDIIDVRHFSGCSLEYWKTTMKSIKEYLECQA